MFRLPRTARVEFRVVTNPTRQTGGDFGAMKHMTPPTLALMIAGIVIGSFGSMEMAIAQTSPVTPNVVLIVADDLGLGDLEAFGGKVPTPNLNRLMQQGVTFRDAHCPASHCSPTRAAIMTGSNLFRMDKRYGSGDPNVLVSSSQTFNTIADVVKGVKAEDGSSVYATSFVGKMHIGENPLDWPRLAEHGYDHAFGLPGGIQRPTNHIIDAQGQLYEDDLGTPWSDGIFNTTRSEIAPMGAILANQARAFIEQNASRPFLLHYNSQAVHGPRKAPKQFITYSGDPAQVLGASDLNSPPMPLGDDAAMILEFDLQVGYILDTLEANDLAENTVVVVTSDNGGLFSLPEMESRKPAGHRSGGWLPNAIGAVEEIRGTKSTPYEGGVRVPMIVRWGTGDNSSIVRGGTFNDQLVSVNDVMASLYDLTGQTIPANQAMDSVSILPTLFNSNLSVRTSAYIQAPGEDNFVDVDTMKGGWRMDDEDGEWVLLFKSTIGRFDERYPEALLASELYNLSTDLSQSVNLLSTPIRIDDQELPNELDLMSIFDVGQRERVRTMLAQFFQAWASFDPRSTPAIDYGDPWKRTPIPGVRGPIQGDTNFDGVIDVADLNNVRNNFGESGFGDATGDGLVNILDLNAVRQNFGQAISTVPEPSTMVVVFMAGVGLLGTRVFRRLPSGA